MSQVYTVNVSDLNSKSQHGSESFSSGLPKSPCIDGRTLGKEPSIHFESQVGSGRPGPIAASRTTTMSTKLSAKEKLLQMLKEKEKVKEKDRSKPGLSFVKKQLPQRREGCSFRMYQMRMENIVFK